MKRRILSLILALSLLAGLTTTISGANLDRRYTTAAGGLGHTLAVCVDKSVYGWGDNSSGQLGLGKNVAHQDTPAQIPELSSVVAVAAGYTSSMSLHVDGTVKVWGGGSIQAPTAVPGLTNVVAIDAGQTDCLALTADGKVYQWTFGLTQPAQVSGLSNIVAIAAGGVHYLALNQYGDVWSWGDNSDGELGDGTTKNRVEPEKIDKLSNIIDIAAGVNFSLAVDFNGDVYGWGNNEHRQMSASMSGLSSVPRPRKIEGLSRVSQVAAGNGFALAMTSDSNVFSWGFGEYGQLGTGASKASDSLPRQISSLTGALLVACGVNHGICLKSNNNTCYVWGRNNNHQLATSGTSNSGSPSKVVENILSEDRTYIGNIGVTGWAKDEIEGLYARKLIPPTLLGRYKDNITRAELAHLLVRMYEVTKGEITVKKENPFQDIQGHSFRDDILKAYELGVISGNSATTFNPNGSVTRQQAAKMICLFVAFMTGNGIPASGKKVDYYKDASSVAPWAVIFVSYAYENDLMKGSNGMFSPNANFTREQCLATVARLASRYNWKATQS